jgi:hypothetical protein
MAKLTLNDIQSLGNQASVIALLNNNSAAVETAFENTLSRDGTTPNQMMANLDLNSYRVINSGLAINNNDLITKGQVDAIAFAGATVEVTVNSSLVTAKDIGCPENGVSDDAVVIQNYMENHSEGGTIHFDGGKTYRFHNRLEIPSNWTLNGNGARVKMNNTAGFFMGGFYQLDADTDTLASAVSAGGNTLILSATDLVTRYPNNARIQINSGSTSEYATVSTTNSGANSILITGTLSNSHAVIGTTIKLLMASPLYANLTTGSNTFDIPDAFASYFTVGDYIQITDSANNFETNRIKSIDTSPIDYTRITLYWDVSRTYTTANLGTVYAIDPCIGAKIENFIIEYAETATADQVHAVETFFSVFCRVHNVYVLNGLTYGHRGNGIRDYKSLGTVFDNCIVADPLYYAAGEGYGITFFYATQGQVSNSLVRGCRHGFLWQDSTDCQINQCISVAARLSDFELHGNNEVGISMNNIKAIPGNIGVGDATSHTAVKLLGGRNITVNNLQVRNWNRNNAYAAIYIEPSATNIMLTDLHVDGAYTGVAGRGLNTTATSTDITIKDSKFSNCTVAIDLSCDNVGGSAYILNNVFIQGNTFVNCTENMVIKRCAEVKITDNIILGKTVGDVWAIVLNATNNVSVFRNLIEKTDKGVYLINSVNALVQRNDFVNLAQSVVGNDGGGNTNMEWMGNAYLRITTPSFSGLGTTASAEVDF